LLGDNVVTSAIGDDFIDREMEVTIRKIAQSDELLPAELRH
jgi:hypothetical protein